MSALDAMKATLLDAKTEAAALRIRVRQLEEKLVEVAAVGEKEADGLRDEVKQLRTSGGLWSGRVQELLEENTRLKEEVERLRTQLAQEARNLELIVASKRVVEELNTPLKDALRAADDALLGLAGEVGWLAGSASAGACIECGSLPWIGTSCRLCKAMNVALKALRPNPAVDGTTSDNTSISKLCPVPSSVTGPACLLDEGHPADSPNRFHRYPPVVTDGPLEGAARDGEGTYVTGKPQGSG